MQTDRIAELRALIAADDAAWRESRNHPSRETLRAYVESGEVLDEAVMNALPALLDCAEALQALLSYTKACEELLNAMPAGQVRMAEEALATLENTK